MKAIVDILNSIMNKHAFTESDSNIESSTIESAPEKVLIFSQFTRMLDLLQPLLNSNGIQFRRLDGKMNRKARDEAVKDFNTNPEVLPYSALL
jgi:SNF2 family DNA or RNA helicase